MAIAKALTDASVSKLKADPTKRLEIPDGLMRGLYLVIQPSGAKSWAVRYRVAGAPRKLTLERAYPAMSLDEARDAARDAIVAAKRGADPAAQKAEIKRQQKSGSEAERTGFESVVRKYLARDAKKNRSWLETARLLGLVPDKDENDPKSFRVLPGGIVEAWGQRSIADIRRGEIIERLDAIVDRGAPIVANRTLAAVRRLFNWAVERDMIDASPASAVKAPAPETSRDRVLSDDEIRWAWKAADGLGYPFGPIVKLLLLTGQRREEVGGMAAGELDGPVWTIPAERAKNGQEHAVPLSAASLSVLKGLPKVAGKRKLMFTTTGETSVSGWSRAKEQLDAAMLRIAREERQDETFEIPHWTLHDLRRTAASNMARLGIAVHVVEKLLNHRSGTIKGVAAVYNRHTYWDERVTAAEALGRHLLAMMSTVQPGNVVRLERA